MTRKLAGFGFAFALSELAAAYLPPSVILLATADFVLASAFLKPAFRNRVLPILLGIALGSVWSVLYRSTVVRPVQDLAGTTVHCKAVVQTDAETSWLEDRQRGTLLLTEIDGQPSSVTVYCSDLPYTEPGSIVSVTLNLTAVEQNRYRMNRYAKGIWLNAEYAGDYHREGTSDSWMFRLYALRQELSARLRRYLPRDLAGLEAAMLLGDKSKLSESLSDMFRTAGVSHLLAVSGLHVSLLCGIFLLGDAKRRRFSPPFLLAQALALVFYMALTGFPVSVLRAGTVYLIALAGYALLQPPDALSSLGAAAVLIGIQPYAVCDLGFQLSFCGVVGVQAASWLVRRERRWVLTRLDEEDSHPIAALLLSLAESLQCAVLATAATLPVLLLHNMMTSGVAILTNLLVVWMLGFALRLGLLALIVSPFGFLAPVLHGISLLLGIWLRWMIGIISFCASLPFSHLDLPRNYTIFVLLVLAVLAVIFLRADKLLFYLPCAAVCLAAAVCFGLFFQRNVVEVVLVGTAGNPCVILTQNARAAVLLRGGTSNARAVQEYLLDHGNPELQTVVDLRTVSSASPLDAPDVVTPTREENGTSCPLLDTMTMTLYHSTDGCFVLIDLDTCLIGASSGRFVSDRQLFTDLFLASGTCPSSLTASVCLTNDPSPSWLDSINAETVYYGPDYPTAILRPGSSIVFQEVQKLAVQ